jgi:CHAD domain-containing protein
VDTVDGRFQRAGYSLAIRDDGGRTDIVLDPWKTQPGRPSLQVRAPVPSASLDGLVDNCPEAMRGTIRAVVGRAPLRELLRLLVRRETYHLTRDDEPLGSMTLVETLAYGDGTSLPTRHEHVELELPSGEDDPDSFASLLRSRFDLRETGESPLPDLLRSRAPELEAVSTNGSGGNFGPKSRAGEVAMAILRRHFHRCLRHEPGTRLGVDPEELHDMRVSIRRMRAAFRLFRDGLPRGAKVLAAEWNWVAGVLGEVRDLDVQIEYLRAGGERRPFEEQRALRELESALRRRRATAREVMLAALDSERFSGVTERMEAWLQRGPRKKPKAGRKNIRGVAPELIERAVKRVIVRGKAIGAGGPDADYHSLRREVKRARYALEFHRPVYGSRTGPMIRRLSRLQDLLGEHQDAIVFLERTARFSDDPLLALEPLRQSRQARAAELRDGFPEAFAAVRGRRWKRLRKALRKKRR